MRSFTLVTLLFLLVTTAVSAQATWKFHHVIKASRLGQITTTRKANKQEQEQVQEVPKVNGRIIPLVWRDDSTSKNHAFQLCSAKLSGVITLEKGVPVVDFWSIGSDAGITQKTPPCISMETDIKDRKFQLDLSPRETLGDPTRVVSVPFRAWPFNVITVPFRIRAKYEDVPTTVTSNIGFALNVGHMRGFSLITNRAITNYSATIGGFIGLSTADLKKAQYKDQSQYVSDQTNAALSYGASLILARNNLGVVLSYGWDHSLGTKSSQWIYQ
jgi:hypothetical protein